MPMRFIVVASSAALLLGGCDREFKKQGACYSISHSATDTILLNQCTGQTWILIADPKSGSTGKRWETLSIGKVLYYDKKGKRLSDKAPDGWSIEQVSP